jgi:hypothetical protein
MYVYLVYHRTMWDCEGEQCEHKLVTTNLQKARARVDEIKSSINEWLLQHELVKVVDWKQFDEDQWLLRHPGTEEAVGIESWGI